MLLRKHLLGSYLKNIYMKSLERIVTLEFETFNEFNELICKKLIVELMGKHSNIILLNEKDIIIDSIRHISMSDTSYRDILPNKPYILPNNEKQDFLSLLSFDEFYNIIKEDLETTPLGKVITDKFSGISKSFINYHIEILKITNLVDDLNRLYKFLKDITSSTLNDKLKFFTITNEDNIPKDYILLLDKNLKNQFSLNFYIDDYYDDKEKNEDFKSYRNSILKLILEALKKYNKRLENICLKLSQCQDMDKYKLYGELLTSNLYKLNNQNLDSVIVENYYDNNKEISIPLDKKYTVNTNAKHYFKKYNKLKNALEVVSEQKKETLLDLNYLESIVFELENSTSISDVQDIFEEISENELFKTSLSKKSKAKKTSKKKDNKLLSFNPNIYEFEGYKIYVGRNNKENDMLTLKFADKNDIWFHTKDIHGSHVILKLNSPKDIIPSNILLHCSELAAKHSKAKDSNNVPVDYCKVQYVKKPNKAKPGMVIYSNNKTLYVNPI